MIVPLTNPHNGESNIIWSGERADLDALSDFIFGDGELCAFPYNYRDGEIILDCGHVRAGDMIHRSADGALRVLRPVHVSVGPQLVNP